jgi:uncharacterized protein
MKTVLILHGIQGYAGIYWQQWLHDSLIHKGYNVIMPSLPNPNDPDRGIWSITTYTLIQKVNPEDLIIVGHSLGVVTALDVIERRNEKIHMLISVAGFATDYGLPLNSYFLKVKDINFDQVRPLVDKKYVIYANDDPFVTNDALEQLAEGLAVRPIVIRNGGNFNTNSGFNTFPMLLSLITEQI